MSSAKNYEDYLSVSERDVKNAGFVEKRTAGKARYYIKDGEKYAVVFSYHEDKEYPLIVEHEVFRALWYPSIFIDEDKRKKMLVPCIQQGTGNHVRIHNLIVPVEIRMHVDHKNRNRFFCVESNLRRCEPRENMMNVQKSLDKHPFITVRKENGECEYGFTVQVQTTKYDIISELEERGFVKRKMSDCVIMKSPYFQSKVDCYMEFRDASRIAYKGMNKEKFIYDIENDFSETLGLLFYCYIIKAITIEEMYQMNLEYWRHKLDK